MKDSGISPVNLGRLANSWHLMFVKQLCDKARDTPAVAARCAKLLQDIDSALVAERATIGVRRGSEHTAAIAQADKDRGRVFMALKRTLEGFAALKHAGMATAAEEILVVVKGMGVNPRMKLESETGAMARLLRELEGELAPQVARLGLQEFVTEMREANDTVYRLTMERTREASMRHTGANKRARRHTDGLVRQLIRTVGALMWIEGPAEFQAFADFVNESVRKQATMHKGRKRRVPPSTAAPADKAETADKGDAPAGVPPEPVGGTPPAVATSVRDVPEGAAAVATSAGNVSEGAAAVAISARNASEGAAAVPISG